MEDRDVGNMPIQAKRFCNRLYKKILRRRLILRARRLRASDGSEAEQLQVTLSCAWLHNNPEERRLSGKSNLARTPLQKRHPVPDLSFPLAPQKCRCLSSCSSVLASASVGT